MGYFFTCWSGKALCGPPTILLDKGFPEPLPGRTTFLSLTVENQFKTKDHQQPYQKLSHLPKVMTVEYWYPVNTWGLWLCKNNKEEGLQCSVILELQFYSWKQFLMHWLFYGVQKELVMGAELLGEQNVSFYSNSFYYWIKLWCIGLDKCFMLIVLYMIV